MSNNLPQEYKSNIFYNIFRKIRSLFFRKKNIEVSVDENVNEVRENNNIEEKSKFVEEIKIKETVVNPEVKKKKFMDNLTDNPELLEKFSNERLEKILQYYKEENDKKRELLKKLSA